LFDQYLRYPAIPKLIISKSQTGKDLTIRFKWKADVPDFRMPVKASTADKEGFFIYPTTEWKSITLPNTKSKSFKLNNIYSYFDIEKTD
jgi:hypothetical protein